MIFCFSQFTFLTLSPLPACLHAFLLVVIHMVFGQWSDSRHFLYFSVSLVLPQYETVQFVPPPPEVGKPGSSVLICHEAIYQGLIVRFTLLEEVFSSLVCARAKSELSNHCVSLSTQAHMRVVESTLTRVVKPRHIAIWCSTSRLCNSTGAPLSSTLVGVLKSLSFDHSYCCCSLLVLSLLVQSFPSLPCSSSQDDGRSSRVDHHCFIFAFSQPYGAISLSPCLRGHQHLPYLLLYLFKTHVKRLLLFCLSDRPWRFHVVICFNSFFLLPSLLFLRFSYLFSDRCCLDLPFSFPSCMEAQGWGEFSSTSSPTDILRDCRHCR